MRRLLLLVLALSPLTVACSSSSSSGSTETTTEAGSDALATTGDTWATWGEAFFTTYCVECHTTGNSAGLDFTKEAIVIANKDVIRCGVSVMQDPSWNCPSNVAAEQFPIPDSTMSNPKPSDDERNRAVAWINAGTP